MGGGGELREREEGHLSPSGGDQRGLPGGSSTQAETRRGSGKERSGVGVEETAHEAWTQGRAGRDLREPQEPREVLCSGLVAPGGG